MLAMMLTMMLGSAAAETFRLVHFYQNEVSRPAGQRLLAAVQTSTIQGMGEHIEG